MTELTIEDSPLTRTESWWCVCGGIALAGGLYLLVLAALAVHS